jgi:hypothetical protein
MRKYETKSKINNNISKTQHKNGLIDPNSRVLKPPSNNFDNKNKKFNKNYIRKNVPRFNAYNNGGSSNYFKQIKQNRAFLKPTHNIGNKMKTKLKKKI